MTTTTTPSHALDALDAVIHLAADARRDEALDALERLDPSDAPPALVAALRSRVVELASGEV